MARTILRPSDCGTPDPTAVRDLCGRDVRARLRLLVLLERRPRHRSFLLLRSGSWRWRSGRTGGRPRACSQGRCSIAVVLNNAVRRRSSYDRLADPFRHLCRDGRADRDVRSALPGRPGELRCWPSGTGSPASRTRALSSRRSTGARVRAAVRAPSRRRGRLPARERRGPCGRRRGPAPDRRRARVDPRRCRRPRARRRRRVAVLADAAASTTKPAPARIERLLEELAPS